MAITNAKFRHGAPVMADYTTTTTQTVSAGDVIVSNGQLFIAHSDIAAARQGAVARGGGVYDVPCDTTDTPADGQILYWDTTQPQATLVSTDGTEIGPVVGTKFGSDRILVQHVPNDA